jgi:hypothetical protein
MWTAALGHFMRKSFRCFSLLVCSASTRYDVLVSAQRAVERRRSAQRGGVRSNGWLGTWPPFEQLEHLVKARQLCTNGALSRCWLPFCSRTHMEVYGHGAFQGALE